MIGAGMIAASGGARIRPTVTIGGTTVTPLANEPSGYTTLKNWDIDTAIPASAEAEIGSTGIYIIDNASGNVVRVTNEDDPQSPPNAATFTYPDGHTSGGGIGTFTSYADAATDQVYVAIWAKWEVGFEWNTISNKFLFVQSSSGAARDCLLQSARNSSPTYFLETYNEGPGDDPLANDVTVSDLADGEWHYIEWAVDAVAGTANTWLDGVQVLTDGDISSNAGGWTEIKTPDTTWGGSTAAKSGDSVLTIGHIYISRGSLT